MNFDLVIAAGGDGTVNEVINGLAGSCVPLGVIPLGTTNVLATEIGIWHNPDAIVGAVLSPTLRAAWLGDMNGRRFSLMASVGFDAEVVAGVDPRMKRLFGRGAYVLTACCRWAAGQPRQYLLEIDGQQYEAAGAIVAKSRHYGGRFLIAPNISIGKPEFSVLVMLGGSRFDLLRQAAALARGDLYAQPGVLVLPAQEVRIRGEMTAPIQADGDVVAWGSTMLRIDPTPLMLLQR
jgi:diacylglycerol kinase family enzyme